MSDPTPTPEPTREATDVTPRRLPKAVIGAAVVVVILLGAGLWWYFDRDNPDEVDLDTAAQSVSSTTAADASGPADATDDGGTPSTAAPSTDLSGTWTVDTTTGEFDFESATGTFAGFRVREELAGIGAAEAVGRTGDVTGTFTIDGTEVTDAEFTVDMTTITTNESMRDRRVQDALNTAQNPTSTFELTSPIGLGADAATASKVDAKAKGDLTINGITKAVTFPLEARLVDKTIVVVGSLEVTFSDFDVEVPSSPKVVSADDHGKIEIQLLLNR